MGSRRPQYLRRWVASLVLPALLLGAVGCRPVRREGGGGSPSPVSEILSPAGSQSGEPNLAAGPGGRLFLSWIEPVEPDAHRLRFSELLDDARWTAPRTVAVGESWFVNWADFPSLVSLPDGSLSAHWLVKSSPETYAYDVHLARSFDGGRGWSDPVVPHRDGTHTEHGFVSLLPDLAGELGVVWLDGRNLVPGAAEMPATALMATTLSSDGQLGPEIVLDPRVCDCCQTAAVATGHGAVVAYRDRSAEEIRDIAVTRFEQGQWTAPETISNDGWQIHGCPVNGPALAALGDDVALAWFTAAQETPRVHLAISHDGGRFFGPASRVDDGNPLGRVDVVLSGGSAWVIWLEGSRQSRILLRRIAFAGEMDPPIVVAETTASRSSGFPQLARAGNRIVVAWTDASSGSRVRTAVLEL